MAFVASFFFILKRTKDGSHDFFGAGRDGTTAPLCLSSLHPFPRRCLKLKGDFLAGLEHNTSRENKNSVQTMLQKTKN